MSPDCLDCRVTLILQISSLYSSEMHHMIRYEKYPNWKYLDLISLCSRIHGYRLRLYRVIHLLAFASSIDGSGDTVPTSDLMGDV